MHTKSSFLFLILLYIAFSINAQPTIEWERSFGGTQEDWPNSIQQTADGGYIVGGLSLSSDGDVTTSIGDGDYWVLKLSPNGEIEWKRSLGGTRYEWTNTIRQTRDGGYIIVGLSRSIDGDVTSPVGMGGGDCWVVKLTPNGEIAWERSYGGSGSDVANAVQQTADGGYIVAGLSRSTDGDVTNPVGTGEGDCWVLKLTVNGGIQWEQSFGGTEEDRVHSIQQTADGGYIFAGFTLSIDGDVDNPIGSGDYWVVKLTVNGEIEWERSLGGTNGDWARSVQQTTDGGYIVAGYSSSIDGDVTNAKGGNGGDYWVVKLTVNGEIEWERSLGGAQDDRARSIQQTADGGYVVAGFSDSTEGDITNPIGDFDYWIVKLTNNGEIEWDRSLGGTGADLTNSIDQTSDRGYITVGWSNSSDGDVTNPIFDFDYWVVKLSPVLVDVNEVSNLVGLSMLPNPAQHHIQISIDAQFIGSTYAIYDISGKAVFAGKIISENTLIGLNNIPSGTYTLQVSTSEGIAVKTFLKKSE